jgi:hypothetical protein
LSNNVFAGISLFLGCARVNRFGDKMTTKGEKIASRFRRGPTAALMTGRPDPTIVASEFTSPKGEFRQSEGIERLALRGILMLSGDRSGSNTHERSKPVSDT